MKLFAKLKTGPNDQRLLMQDMSEPIFSSPDYSAAVKFDPLEEPDKGQWLYVELEFFHIEKMLDPYITNLNEEADPIDPAEYYLSRCIYQVTTKEVLFKRVSSSMLVPEHGTKYLDFGALLPEASQKFMAIELTDGIDAVYVKSDQRIYFQNFSRARALFKGFDIFHQDATTEQKEQFFDHELFTIHNVDPHYISLGDTKRLIRIVEDGTLDLTDEQTKDKIRAYAQTYASSGLGVDPSGRLMIHSRKDISTALKILEQKYFTSELTGEKFVAGSAKPLPRGQAS